MWRQSKENKCCVKKNKKIFKIKFKVIDIYINNISNY